MSRRKKSKSKMKMKGGSAFVGKPWGPPVSSWPGVSGVHDGDHLAYNSYKNFDPYTGHIISERDMRGGFTYSDKDKKSGKSGKSSKSKKSSRNMTRRKTMKGGTSSTFPLLGDLVTMTSRLSNTMTSNFDKIVGNAQPVSPLPWKNQFGYK